MLERVGSWWQLTGLARSGGLGPSFNERSSEAATLAQKLAALHPNEPDAGLVEQLRPLIRRRGVKTTEVLALLKAPTDDDSDTYERARRLVEFAAEH